MSRKAAIGMLVQVGIGLMLMFIGWGLDDLSGFFGHPARAGLMVFALLGVFWTLAWRLDVQVFRRGRQPVGRQRWGLALAMAVGLFLVWFLPYGDRRAVLTFAAPDAVRYLGLGLYIIGNAIVLFALRTLGRHYSGYITLQENHQLVQSGIYAVIRHPIYLRALLVSVGLPLIFRSWLVLPLVTVVALWMGQRIRQEETLLAEQFGAAFEDYRRRTWRLVPHLY